MAVGTPTTAEGTSATPAVAVPAGVAAGDIVVLVVTQDVAAGVFTGKWPASFTQLIDADCTADGQSLGIAWKRLTGADSGSYTLASTGNSSAWLAVAIPLTGRHATNPPTISANSIQNTAQASPVTVTANGVTAVAGDDVLFISMPDVTATGVGNGHSGWSAGYTEIVDAENVAQGTNNWGNIGVAKAENVSAGATGTKSVTFTLTSGSSGWGAWLLAFPVAAGGAGQNITGAGAVGSAEAIGTAQLDLNVSPSGVASAEAVGSHTVTGGAVTVSPSGIASAEAVGSHTVTPGAVTVSPSGIASAEAVGTPQLDLNVAPAGIASAEAVGTPTITVGPVTVSPSGIPSAEAVGLATISGGAPGGATAKQLPTLGVG